MLVKTSIGISVLSLALFSWFAITGAKGPNFNTGGAAGSTSGGRGSSGSGWIWHGGK
jgi:hypothetical protein